jgi:hypothetical protein
VWRQFGSYLPTKIRGFSMADNTSGGSNALYFIVGALVVVVGIGVFVYSGGYFAARKTTTEQTTTIPLIGSTTTITTTTEKPAR